MPLSTRERKLEAVRGAWPVLISKEISPKSVNITTLSERDLSQDKIPPRRIYMNIRDCLPQVVILNEFIKYPGQVWFSDFLEIVIDPGGGFFYLDYTVQINGCSDDHRITI